MSKDIKVSTSFLTVFKTKMPNFKNAQYVYHMTALENIPSILMSGLRCREDLEPDTYFDIAEESMIFKRAEYNLEKFVPFHWVYGSDFDYSIHNKYEDIEFAYIVVDRDVAKNDNWKVAPQHPLSSGNHTEILDYSIGFNKIKWNSVIPNYPLYGPAKNQEIHLTTMAECLAPGSVPVKKFSKIYISSEESIGMVFDSINENIESFEDSSDDADDFFAYHHHSSDQSMNDIEYDQIIFNEDFISDLFEIREDIFKNYANYE